MRSVSATVLLAALLGCGNLAGPGSDLRYALARRECGQPAGWATMILLAPEPFQLAGPQATPYIRLVVPRPLDQVQGSWQVSHRIQDVNAVYFIAGQYEIAYAGELAVNHIRSDTTVEGSVSLWFPNRRVVTGFRATWVPGFPQVCPA